MVVIWSLDSALGVILRKVSSTYKIIEQFTHVFMSFCAYSILGNMHLNANKILQTFECVNLYEKCNGLPLFMRNELSGDSLRLSFLRPSFPEARAEKKKLPDGVSAVCLAVNFLWENATFAVSNHKSNPIKSYYVNVNREREIKQHSEMFHLGPNELISQGIKNPH